MRWPPNAAKPQHTMKKRVKILTTDKRSDIHLPIRGVTAWTPHEKKAPAMATPRSFHVVDSAPAATRRYEEKVMALLADTSRIL